MEKNNQYTISRMSKDEILIAIDWARKEGWNPGLHDGECFYQTDPEGFFAGKLNGTIIALGSAVIYDDEFAFCGFYIVDPAYRDKGYGLELTKERLKYVGSRNAGIDGVVSMLDKYKRLGYKLAYNNARYRGSNLSIAIKKNPSIVPLSQIKFTDLSNFDRKHFPARREVFLRCWMKQQGGKSIGFVEDKRLCGYGVIRPCFEGFKIGPLFAENPTIADELFMHLAEFAKEESIYLDIPECNKDAVELATRYQLEKVFATARMYLKKPPQVLLNEIYGITSFELG